MFGNWWPVMDSKKPRPLKIAESNVKHGQVIVPLFPPPMFLCVSADFHQIDKRPFGKGERRYQAAPSRSNKRIKP
jgi:hypothetical protein